MNQSPSSLAKLSRLTRGALVANKVVRERLGWSAVAIAAGLILTTVSFFVIECRVLHTLPPAWWGWYDQGQYLDAARAFASMDLSTARHWYPPGYSLLAVPFLTLFPNDPFMLVDLLCLLGSLLASVRLGRILELPAWIGVATFLLTTVAQKAVLRHYVLPWTTTATSCLILIGFCLCLGRLSRKNSLFLGLIVGGILLIKPIDIVALLPVGLYFLYRLCPIAGAGPMWRLLARQLFPGLLAVITMASGAVGLHYAIYGWHMSGYEAMTTAGPVFLSDKIAFRLYILFVNPTSVYGPFHEIVGIGNRFPWLALGLCGMVLASTKKLSYAAVSLSTILYVVLYASYFDFTPYNAWYGNVWHYYIWILPICGLFSVYFCAQVLIGKSYKWIALPVVMALALFSIHPYLSSAGRPPALSADGTLNVDVSNCPGPCLVDVASSSIVIDAATHHLSHSENDILSAISIAPETLKSLRPRTSFIYLTEQGYRILFLDTTHVLTARIVFSGEPVAKITCVTTSTVKWRFL